MSQSPITLSEQIADAALRRFGEPVRVPQDLPGQDSAQHRFWYSSSWRRHLSLVFQLIFSSSSKSFLSNE